MMSDRQEQASRTLVWAAFAAGTVHAAFSTYWALGGQWLLDTVGRWAVARAAGDPAAARLALLIVAGAKLLAAAVPVVVIYGRLPRPRAWRTLCWIGGIGLVLYGGLNILVSNAVLAGIIRPASGYDKAAMVGHAWLWDPLFFIWGAALCLALLLSHPTGRSSAPRR